MSKRRPGSRHHARLHKGKWERFRKEIFERDGWRCVKCGGAGRLECHHRVRLEHGGDPYDPANCEALCRDCHIREHHPPDPEREAWRELVQELVDTI